jgi:hypothetical protein
VNDRSQASPGITKDMKSWRIAEKFGCGARPQILARWGATKWHYRRVFKALFLYHIEIRATRQAQIALEDHCNQLHTKAFERPL